MITDGLYKHVADSEDYRVRVSLHQSSVSDFFNIPSVPNVSQ